MSRAFDSYYRDVTRDAYRKNAQRLNQDAAKPVEERKKPVRRMVLAGAKKTTSLTEAGMPGEAPPMPPGPPGPEAGPGAMPPMPPMAPSGPPPDAAGKGFTAIILDAKNWLEQQKIALGELPADSPEMSTINSAIGMMTEYLPQPGQDPSAVADQVNLLSQKLDTLFPGGGTGEVAHYIQALSIKLSEFRATIDVTSAPPPPAEPPAPEPEAHPKAAPKPEAQPPARPDQLAKGLEIASGVQ